MIKLEVNKQKDNTNGYQVSGLYKQNGKDYKCQLIVYAEDEEQAKVLCNKFKEVQPIKIDYRTMSKIKAVC